MKKEKVNEAVLKPEGALKGGEGKYITKFEYVCLILARVGDLVKTMQAKPDYMKTCLWLLAFLLVGYALSNLLKSIILKTMYNVEGETKRQMYKELEEMRIKRHSENEEITNAEAAV